MFLPFILTRTTTLTICWKNGLTLDDFLVRAALAGLAVAVAAGPVGCFVVWRRMAYFGDATAHSAILGIVLSLAFGISVFTGVFFSALAVAMIVSLMSGRLFESDTILGVASHSALAFGLVLAALVTDTRIDLEAYLFGEILAVKKTDLLFIWMGSIGILALVAVRWSALLLSTLNEDIARASGLNPKNENLAMNLAIAALVAVSIKVVGALLITAMLIIPAASARRFSRTPERMAVHAVCLGSLSILLGLFAHHSSWTRQADRQSFPLPR